VAERGHRGAGGQSMLPVKLQPRRGYEVRRQPGVRAQTPGRACVPGDFLNSHCRPGPIVCAGRLPGSLPMASAARLAARWFTLVA
jgi:hypothetical protein